jgi:hypothetical protein
MGYCKYGIKPSFPNDINFLIIKKGSVPWRWLAAYYRNPIWKRKLSKRNLHSKALNKPSNRSWHEQGSTLCEPVNTTLKLKTSWPL